MSTSASSYCLDCGRLMPSDKRSDPTPRKFCSAACRTRSKEKFRIEPRHRLSLAFRDLLEVNEAAQGKKKICVLCSDVERHVYHPGQDLDLASDAPPALQEPPADAREEARRAARRIVAFGWRSQAVEEDRGVEAVQDGKVITETSFAKGEWGLRWRRS